MRKLLVVFFLLTTMACGGCQVFGLVTVLAIMSNSKVREVTITRNSIRNENWRRDERWDLHVLRLVPPAGGLGQLDTLNGYELENLLQPDSTFFYCLRSGRMLSRTLRKETVYFDSIYSREFAWERNCWKMHTRNPLQARLGKLATNTWYSFSAFHNYPGLSIIVFVSPDGRVRQWWVDHRPSPI